MSYTVVRVGFACSSRAHREHPWSRSSVSSPGLRTRSAGDWLKAFLFFKHETDMIARRTFLIRVGGLLPVAAAARRLAAQWPQPTPPSITVYKSRSCGCCVQWIDHVRAAGFEPAVFDQEEMETIKD